jgi:ATP-dependent DNA ligase
MKFRGDVVRPYRLMVVRESNRVQLRTKRGHDYAKRFPLIVESAHGSTALMAHCSCS